MNSLPQDSIPRSWWGFPLLLLMVLLGVIASRQSGIRAPTAAPSDESQRSRVASPVVVGESVALTIDFGNGAQRHFAALAWQPEMTVEALMAAAADFRPGLSYRQTGQGERAFLTQVDGIGAWAGENRYWQYSVNDHRADRSFGSVTLQPGDRVLWKFAAED